ncbi:MAG: hypothetical protein J6B98_06050 [Bacilli bacterium]|nr:hypothetical protein [Bacilli bacterium]
MTEDIETLRKRMFVLKLELEKIPKSTNLSNEEKKQREKLIKSIDEEYKKVKKQITRIKLEEKEKENEKYKR